MVEREKAQCKVMEADKKAQSYKIKMERMKKQFADLESNAKKAIEEKDGDIVKVRSESIHYQKKLLRTKDKFQASEKKLQALEKELEERRAEIKDIREKEARVAALEAELSSIMTIEDLKHHEIKRNIRLDVLEEVKAREDDVEANEKMVRDLLEELSEKTTKLVVNRSGLPQGHSKCCSRLQWKCHF